MRRLTYLIILLLIIQIPGYSQYPVFLRPISVYYGSSFRFDNKYRHVITIDNWHYSSTCLSSRYFGFGLTSEFTDKTNFNVGLRYYRAFGTRNRILIRHPVFFYSIAPSVYTISGHQGMNVAPEVGIHPIVKFTRHEGLSVFIYYGYDIPVVNQKDYNMTRHRLTLKIGLDYYRNKEHRETSDTTSTN